MTSSTDSAATLIDAIKRKAPEYLDLLTAQNDPEFESAFDFLLENAIDRLERNSKNFDPLDENGLTAVLACTLSIPGLVVTQETNSNGHVDITIQAPYCSPARTKLGEAKIYNGAVYHVAGLKQLLDRYSTGREGRGLLIVYVRKGNIAKLILGLRNEMDVNRPLRQQGVTENHSLKWSFLSKHEHTCGDTVQVGHIGCNLYCSK